LRLWSKGYRIVLIPEIVCAHEFGTSVSAIKKVDKKLLTKFKFSFTKNSIILLSMLRKYLINTYLLNISRIFMYAPIEELIHFPRYLYLGHRYTSLGNYFPGINLVRMRYITKTLSTINEYGYYVPLLIRFKENKAYKKIFTSNPIKPISTFDLDYYDCIITDKEINNSHRKFIIDKLIKFYEYS